MILHNFKTMDFFYQSLILMEGKLNDIRNNRIKNVHTNITIIIDPNIIIHIINNKLQQ